MDSFSLAHWELKIKHHAVLKVTVGPRRHTLWFPSQFASGNDGHGSSLTTNPAESNRKAPVLIAKQPQNDSRKAAGIGQ